MPVDAVQPLQLAVEAFVYREAALLDEWRLNEWGDLFTEDGSYLVPPCDLTPSEGAASDPGDTLFLIADQGLERIRARVKRLLSRTAHAENPHSRTRHLVSNVRVVGEEAGSLEVHANFVAYRVRHNRVDQYIGHYEYRLASGASGFKIREKRAILDLESLDPAGNISFIL